MFGPSTQFPSGMTSNSMDATIHICISIRSIAQQRHENVVLFSSSSLAPCRFWLVVVWVSSASKADNHSIFPCQIGLQKEMLNAHAHACVVVKQVNQRELTSKASVQQLSFEFMSRYVGVCTNMLARMSVGAISRHQVSPSKSRKRKKDALWYQTGKE